jgi:hypothetical protein
MALRSPHVLTLFKTNRHLTVTKQNKQCEAHGWCRQPIFGLSHQKGIWQEDSGEKVRLYGLELA